jgi:Holliday junction DNA helicase RuvA
MIASIKGSVEQKLTDSIILETGGIGYEVFVAAVDYGAASVGQQLKLMIYEHIREDAHVLYGFSDQLGRQLFEQLLTVTGIGPKVAMAVLSAAPVERLGQAIATGDPELLRGVSGVGKKTAERIIVELRGKVQAQAKSAGAELGAVSQDDTYQALIGLGYSVAQAAQALTELPSSLTGQQDRLKAALKVLSK